MEPEPHAGPFKKSLQSPGVWIVDDLSRKNFFFFSTRTRFPRGAGDGGIRCVLGLWPWEGVSDACMDPMRTSWFRRPQRAARGWVQEPRACRFHGRPGCLEEGSCPPEPGRWSLTLSVS